MNIKKYIKSLFKRKKFQSPITGNGDDFMLRSRSRIPGSTGRRIYINLPLPPHQIDHRGNPKTLYRTNKVITSKYTLLTFIPKNLFEQFRRVANIYFLFLIILQMIPLFEVGSRILVVFPLSIVLCITAAKDGFEDFKRMKLDKVYNSSMVKLLSNWKNVNNTNVKYGKVVNKVNPVWNFITMLNPFRNKGNIEVSEKIHPEEGKENAPIFKGVFWEDVKVGDIIKIHKDESVPADLVILSTSESSGECYVETKSLDGETNLKSRNALDETSFIKHTAQLTNLKAYIDTDPPSSNLYVCNGSISLVKKKNNENLSPNVLEEPQPPTPEPSTPFKRKKSKTLIKEEAPNVVAPFNIKNVLLRGYVVKNTDFVYGVVVFTGKDTRIMLNSGKTPSKRSKIEVQMNRQILNNFFVLLIVSLCLAIGYGIFCWVFGRDDKVAELFGLPHERFAYEGFLNFWSAIILLQTLIPISLYVSIEFVKTWQAFFIYNDIEMYSKEKNAVCVPKAWNLSDDLGQVSYIFSDKTGTLTRNVMEFKKCSINGIVYGKSLPGKESDVEIAELRKLGKYNDGEEVMEEKRNKMLDEYFTQARKIFSPETYVNMDYNSVSFADKIMFNEIYDKSEQGKNIESFFGLLALCHTVLVEEREERSGSLLSRNSSMNSNDKDHSSASKPTIVYRAESPDEKALVSAAKDCGFTFLGKTKNTLTMDWLGETKEFELLDLIEFDSTRKRMSVLLKRPAPWNDHVLLIKGADNVILERLGSASNDIIDKTKSQIRDFSNIGLRTLCLAYRLIPEEEVKAWRETYNTAMTTFLNREEMIYKAADLIEKDLTLLGATAIEDKLQDEVPNTIASLRQAGIKVWVLTGDKMETAINIGFASQLLTDDMHIWTVNVSPTAREVLENFQAVCDKFVESREKLTLGQDDVKLAQNALVIDGNALKYIIESKEARTNLANLAPLFQSVVCCRVSPLQKAQVVHLIKKSYNAITLAIGDGANDVSMIQEAHIGVAISGEEGLQASMAADYSFSQFKYLKNLLLVHGLWSYLRISEMVLSFFYKNLIFVMTSFWYQFNCGFSANIFFEFTYGQAYNLFFTSAPVVFLGFLDRHLNYQRSMAHPEIYNVGIQGRKYSLKLFWLYMLDGIWQSLVCYYFFFALSGEQSIATDGSPITMYEFSTMSVLMVIGIANFTVGFSTKAWTYLMFLGVLVPTFLVFFYAPLYSLVFFNDYHGVAIHLYGYNIQFWLSIPLVFVSCLLPRYVLNAYQLLFEPNEVDVVRERYRLKIE